MKLIENNTVLVRIDEHDIKGDGSLILPASVTSIRRNTFPPFSKVKTVIFPQGFRSIDEQVFSGCTELETLIFPETPISIGNEALADCSKLKILIIPQGSFIGRGALRGCHSLETLIIHKDSIREEVLRECSSPALKIIDLPDEFILGPREFAHCYYLERINLPARLSSIGDEAFLYCKKLSSITIPQGVTLIGNKAFYGCHSLETVVLPEGLRSIGEQAFANCPIRRILISSTDETEITRITALLPKNLQCKVIPNELADEVFGFIKEQLSIIAQTSTPAINPLYQNMIIRHRLSDDLLHYINSFNSDNIYHQITKELIDTIPFPKNKKEMASYKDKIQQISERIIKVLYYANNLNELLNAMEHNEHVFREEGHADAADAAEELHQQIRISLNHYSFFSRDEEFNEICHEAIDEARSLLQEHRPINPAPLPFSEEVTLGELEQAADELFQAQQDLFSNYPGI